MASKNQNIPLADAEMKIPKVFISYNHKDQKVALKIKDKLEMAGIEVIIDVEAMATGENIEGFIKKCIKESGITLSLISANSLMSAWVAMETVWSSYDETLRGRYFMPCNIDNSIFERSFPDQALDALDEQIKEIDNTIQIRLQKVRGIEDLTDERTRINHLKVELPSIVGRLKNSLCVNLSDEQFDAGMVKVINDIKNSLIIKALTDPNENKTKLSTEQHDKKHHQKAEQQSNFHVADEIKMGRILYKIAETMQLNRTERCEIRIAKKEISLIKLLKGLVKDKVKIEGVKVSDDMEVKLVSSGNNAFRIVSITNQEQLIDNDSFTQWIFDVTPLMTGNQLLTLLVSMITRNVHDKEIKKDVVFERIINVVTSEVELKPSPTFKYMNLKNLVGNNHISPQVSSSTTINIKVNSSVNKNLTNDLSPDKLTNIIETPKSEKASTTSLEEEVKNTLLSGSTVVISEESKVENSDNYYDNTVGNIPNIEMVFVKGGKFRMGDDNSKYERKKPTNKVVVSDFYIGKYPVTQKQWVDIMGYNPSYFKGCDDCPVENVSWYDIHEFIQKLNKISGKTYRLPTEAEWEYAARSGVKRAYGPSQQWSGTDNENDLGDFAWYNKNSNGKTHPIGTKKPNSLGIYDMSGNVCEWCKDWFKTNYYPYVPSDNPYEPFISTYRVFHGGSWILSAAFCRSDGRYYDAPGNRRDNLGFRMAFDP